MNSLKKLPTSFGFLFILYLLLGNIPRLWSRGAGDALNVLEPVIYSCSILYVIRHRAYAWKVQWVWACCGVILFWILIGILGSGMDLGAIAYAVRYVCTLISGLALGTWMFVNWQHRSERVLSAFGFSYVAVALASFAILALFPESVLLWQFLALYGIEVNGDPHIGRLVSTYFDPNFYAAIIALPVLITGRSAIRQGGWRWLGFGILLASCVLTVSRSGTAVLFMSAFVLFLPSLSRALYFMKVRYSTLGLLLVAVCAAGIVAALNVESLERLVQRVGGTSSDDSALARLDSFDIGMRLILERPFFGYGYNFSQALVVAQRGIGLDSSVQVILVSFGVIGAFVLLMICGLGWVQTHAALKRDSRHAGLFYLFSVYLFFAVLFGSNFNQLLFYPFWAIPCVALGAYFSVCSKERGGQPWQ